MISLMNYKQNRQILSMMNGFPEIITNNSRQPRQSSQQKKSKQTPPKVSYRGITLKEYFRLCDQVKPSDVLRQIKEESCASSNSSMAGTPTFQQDQNNRQFRGKIKTEVCQPDHQHAFKKTYIRLTEHGEKDKLLQAYSLEKSQKPHYVPVKKKEERKKIYTKMHVQYKEPANIRSTLNSFYQVEENKRKMLKKIQLEKERVNDLRLSEAFFITKYGTRFRLDTKTIKGD